MNAGTPLTPNATDRLYCGCLPRSAKCPASYGLVKAGIAHTSGRLSKGAEQSCTSCFEVQRRVAQRELDTMCAPVYHVSVWRACLQTNPPTQGPCRMAPALPGIPHWEFFLVSFHFSLTYYSLSYEDLPLIRKTVAIPQTSHPRQELVGRQDVHNPQIDPFLTPGPQKNDTGYP